MRATDAGEIGAGGISALQRAFEKSEWTAAEGVEAFLERIALHDPKLKACSMLRAERALERAVVLDRERAGHPGLPLPPLFGVPMMIKDLCDWAGEPTRAGTVVLGERPARSDAEVVERLERAGAVILGKTRMTEGALAMHHPSVEPPVNPWNPARWTGISSSGSGVAVAAGLCLGALGTDTGGSIRFPSAACGITGLKPTHGRVSLRGVFPLAGSLDHIGPMARSVDDVARLFAVLAGPDPGDPWSLLAQPHVASPSTLSPRVRGVRIGIDRRYASEGVDASIQAAVEEALGIFRELGAMVIEVELPSREELLGAWLSLVAAEAAEAHAETFPERAADYGPELRGMLELGQRVDGRSVARAAKARIAFSRRLANCFEQMDVLIAPVIADLRPADTNLSDVERTPGAAGAIRFTAPFNLSGLPALSLPGGFDRDGAPIGFQLVAPPCEEDHLLALGAAFQSATDWHSMRPAL
jgi:amidase